MAHSNCSFLNAGEILEIKGRHGFQQLTTIIEISKTCGKLPGYFWLANLEMCENKDWDRGGCFMLFACGALRRPLVANAVEETYRSEPDPHCRFLSAHSRIVPKP